MANVIARQYSRHALADLSVSTAATTTIVLPPKTLVLGGIYSVVTGATGTSPTLTMVDNSGSPVTYLSAVAISAVADGTLAAAGVGLYYPAGATLSFSTGGTTPAGGRVLVALEYLVVDTQHENYGPSQA